MLVVVPIPRNDAPIMHQKPLGNLPPQPANQAWPAREWPESSIDSALPSSQKTSFDQLIERATSPSPSDPLGETHALLLIRNGQIIFEHYPAGTGPADTQKSWSMAKSITQALVGIAVRKGLLTIHDRAPVPEWSDPEDPRHAITWDQLLRMSSGLDWIEEYVPGQPSDVIEMLFGENALANTGAYAANKSLVHPPGSHWLYSSGTTNIIARALSEVLGGEFGAIRDFMFAELFDKIGMASPMPVLDKVGTFVGSSFCYSTPRDFARFGYLYLRDGIWDGERILPEGWVDYARTPTPVPETESLGYGAHWWLGLCGPESFSANGFQGQYTIVLPDLDMVIVRHGLSEGDPGKEAVQQWLADLADCFRE